MAQFYDLLNGWGPDFDLCMDLADRIGARSVLDIGCGTGELAVSLAPGRRVVGVDPAVAMLDIAKARPGGADVEWIQGTAQTITLDGTFDLIVMTSHAFQTLLTDADQTAAFRNVARLLSAQGMFLFDSRNPDAPGAKSRRKGEQTRRITHPTLGAIEMWNASTYDVETGLLRYTNGFRNLATGQEQAGDDCIRFTPWLALEQRMRDAGLRITALHGTWTGDPFTPTSPEIIPIAQIR